MVYLFSEKSRSEEGSLAAVEGSHSGLVRPPAKRLPRESGVKGSNPFPSARNFRLRRVGDMPLDLKGAYSQYKGFVICLTITSGP